MHIWAILFGLFNFEQGGRKQHSLHSPLLWLGHKMCSGMALPQTCQCSHGSGLILPKWSKLPPKTGQKCTFWGYVIHVLCPGISRGEATSIISLDSMGMPCSTSNIRRYWTNSAMSAELSKTFGQNRVSSYWRPVIVARPPHFWSFGPDIPSQEV